MENRVKNTGARLLEAMGQVIVGQNQVLEELLVAVVAQGHVLLEGVPGIGKTVMVKTLAALTDCAYSRIQFTPDLMPSDVTGNNVFNFQSSQFVLKRGPVFTNFLLADEINRTPPKTQAALLEVMEERQVTIDGQSNKLDEPFVVFATQNPIEQEGTYPLPEAQLDRFLMKILLSYPEQQEEKVMLTRFHQGNDSTKAIKELQPILNREDLSLLRQELNQVLVEESLLDYIIEIVRATRTDYNLVVGASPRAALALLLCSKSLAAMQGRNFVTPDDVKRMSLPVLRHRVVLKPEAEIEGLSPDRVIRSLVDGIKVPM